MAFVPTDSAALAQALIGRRKNVMREAGSNHPGWSPSLTPVNVFSDPRVKNSSFLTPSEIQFDASRPCGTYTTGLSDRYYRDNVNFLAKYAGVPKGTMNQMCGDLSAIASGSDPYGPLLSDNHSNRAFHNWLSNVQYRYQP